MALVSALLYSLVPIDRKAAFGPPLLGALQPSHFHTQDLDMLLEAVQLFFIWSCGTSAAHAVLPKRWRTVPASECQVCVFLKKLEPCQGTLMQFPKRADVVVNVGAGLVATLLVASNVWMHVLYNHARHRLCCNLCDVRPSC